ncbi:serine/threonine-protein kinase [Novipirellula sp.]|uniref:serine/threonine-protein kinase n=1 Tax=Novipirellula sp. TaxID=2795430 RepID=UPI00356346B0
MADNEPTADPVDEAFAAYLRSCDAGELTSREDFLKQFPDVAGQLKQLMEAADLLGQVTMASGLSSHRARVQNGADTVAITSAVGEQSDVDPAITLPMANRSKNDPGPTLPFDLGDYELQEVLGKGGMGIVYLANQKQLNRMVAVKMIRGGMLADESDVRRFYTEAQAAARLSHPGIVPVYQFGQRAGHHFFSMAYIRGIDLQRKIYAETLHPKQAARYVRDVARAIDHAHHKGVLHRDLKPANVLIDEYDEVHVTDFGLAKHMDADSSVTGTGAALGTPHYMAPEQAGGLSDRANRQSDVYAMGAILFACLTGRPPIVGDTVMQTLLDVVHNPAPPVRYFRSDAPVDIETIVAKCLEKSPQKRYESAGKLADDLDAFLEDRPIKARPRSLPVKVWHWLEGVPLVAAVSGRRMVSASTSHRRFQAVMLLLLLLTPFVAVGLSVLWHKHKESMPSFVRIGGGLDDGVYNTVSTAIAERLAERYQVTSSVATSNGSLENRSRLLSGEVHLAPMQASAISGSDLCVVAPLFFEVVHLLVREDANIQELGDLKGHRIAVGPIGSGSREATEMVFESLAITPDIAPREVMAWKELESDAAPDVAVICVGLGSPLIANLIRSHRWELMPIPNPIKIALQHPTLRPMTIDAGDYPGIELPEEGVATVGTTAFLAARTDTPSELVTATLRTLYEPPLLCAGLIPRKHAAEWQGLALHSAARRFFEVNETTP